MNYEIPQPKIVIWQGIELYVKRVDPQLVILSTNTPEDQSYPHAVDRITSLNLWAVKKISELPLGQFDRNKPSFACIVIPQATFLGSTGIPENYSWAKICSRSLWREGREDLVVTSSQYADFFDFNTKTPLETLDEKQIDVLREIVHEHLPTMRDHYLRYPSAKCLPISEAMDELIPRYIFGLQAHMPTSTAFLRNIFTADLLTIQDLWTGFSQHSSEPVSKNRAYGSAFLLGLGLISQIEEICEADPKSALSKWMDAIVEAKTPKSAVNLLASIANLDKKEVWQGKTLQLKGQEALTQKNHP